MAGSAAAQTAPAEPAPAPAAEASASVEAGAAAEITPVSAPEAPPNREAPFDLRHRGYSTLDGSSGGIFIVDPGIGEAGSVRLQLALDTFSSDDFLFEGDEVEQDRQSLSASWTAVAPLEIFAAIHNRATVADRPRANSLHVLGDLLLGFKLRADLGLFRVGGGARLELLNGIGERETLLDATNIGLTAAAALDLQNLSNPVPLVFRLNLDYLFDNSAEVIDPIEDIRYEDLEVRADRDDETQHLVTRVERFGLDINRVDMFTIGVGVEVPLQVTESFFLLPVVDFGLGIPVNRQDYNCPFFSDDEDRGTNEAGADDTCIDDAGFEANPINLAVGLRVVPPVRGLTALLGVDFAINGDTTFVRELAPQAPYRVMFAIGYDYDARPEPKQPAPVAAAALPPPAPRKTRIIGRVTDATTGAPIPGVLVKFPDPALPPVATDHDGRFISYELDPGEIELTLSHADYESRACGTSISKSPIGDVEIACQLAPLPVAGSLKLGVRDAFGAPLAGVQLQLSGPSIQNLMTDPSGTAQAADLVPGEYTVRTTSDAYLSRAAKVTVEPRQQARLDLALTPRPAKSAVVRQGTELRVAALRFEGQTAELGPAAALAVAEVADLLLRDPNLRLRIQGDGGESLALGRALAIKQRLVDAGVADGRLEVAPEPAKTVTLTLIP